MRPAARRRGGLRFGACAPAPPGRRYEERRRLVPARRPARVDPVAGRGVEPAGDGDAVAKVGGARPQPFGRRVQRGGRTRVLRKKCALLSVTRSEPISGRSYWLRK